MEVDFVLETVNQLVEKHGVSLQKETLIHSDQGVHYTSYKFIQIVNDAELRQSTEINFDDDTQNVLMVFLGVMFGVNAANTVLVKFAAENAAKMGAKVAAQPLSKYALYNVVKKVLG